MGTVCRASLIVAFITIAACGSHSPTAPGTNNPITTPPTALPVGPIPPATGPYREFTYASADIPPTSNTVNSRFLLYDNGSFTLRYTNVQYRGIYVETAREIMFTWEGSSVTAPWSATGTLNGDALTVRYNAIMVLSDFEDATYKRTN